MEKVLVKLPLLFILLASPALAQESGSSVAYMTVPPVAETSVAPSLFVPVPSYYIAEPTVGEAGEVVLALKRQIAFLKDEALKSCPVVGPVRKAVVRRAVPVRHRGRHYVTGWH